ncbi:hypothetical protein BDV95DRAFT_5908 [Massariosphaeria phaeospora]|uniref:Uncharacterized protein n=1 Tax=Massariosphaeria phaeospora TaxID=100035 RepID=A0A7C8MJL0_9PLEO|nr:hypothetical protein BDV95DRAFT_5908 [Massariosphaeria phaeospora]
MPLYRTRGRSRSRPRPPSRNRSQPRPPKTTLHIISYSHHRAQRSPHARTEIRDAIPRDAMYLYTVDCTDWQLPPPEFSAWYSSASPQWRNWIMGTARGRAAVTRAVDDALRRLRPDHSHSSSARSVALCTASPHGSHRSVATAEAIADEALRRGVDACRVVHLHLHHNQMRKLTD